MIEVLTPVGRIVQGHPMEMKQEKDDKGAVKMQAGGVTPVTSLYVALAIPKGAEQHWNQTEWGGKIWQEITQSWPNGEYNNPTFSYKIEDGDSQIPNKKGKKNADREGFPGHWIIKAGTQIPVGCYHAGKYQPHEVIQNPKEIKCGDYGRLNLQVKGNNSQQTPGIYINPTLFELSRAGMQIMSDNTPDAAATFGGVAPEIPQNAQVDNSVQQQPTATPAPQVQQPTATPAPQVQPAQDFLNGPAPMGTPAPQPAPQPAPAEVKYVVNGAQYTAEQLKASGWDDAQIAGLPTA